MQGSSCLAYSLLLRQPQGLCPYVPRWLLRLQSTHMPSSQQKGGGGQKGPPVPLGSLLGGCKPTVLTLLVATANFWGRWKIGSSFEEVLLKGTLWFLENFPHMPLSLPLCPGHPGGPQNTSLGSGAGLLQGLLVFAGVCALIEHHFCSVCWEGTPSCEAPSRELGGPAGLKRGGDRMFPYPLPQAPFPRCCPSP